MKRNLKADLIAHVAKLQGLTHAYIAADALGVKPETVRKHVRQLVNAGVFEEFCWALPDYRYYVLQLTDEARRDLTFLGPELLAEQGCPGADFLGPTREAGAEVANA